MTIDEATPGYGQSGCRGYEPHKPADVSPQEVRRLADDWHSGSQPRRNVMLNLAAQVERLTAERDAAVGLLREARKAQALKRLIDLLSRMAWSSHVRDELDRIIADLEAPERIARIDTFLKEHIA